MSPPPLFTSGRRRAGYQIEGLARGPLARSTNLQPYRAFTRTLPIPLTKNENPLASVKAKHAALRENLAGSNGCTTSGAKQGDNHTGITSLHSPASDARMGSEINVISDLCRITQPAACTVGYVFDTPQQQSATCVPGIDLSEPPMFLPCISREAAVSPVISHAPPFFRPTSERNAAVNVSDKDHSSDLSGNLAGPVNRSGSKSSPSNRLVSILFPQGVTPPNDKTMALTVLQLPRHMSLDATTVLSVPVDSNIVTLPSVSGPIQSSPDMPLMSSLVPSGCHVVPVSKLPPSAGSLGTSIQNLMSPPFPNALSTGVSTRAFMRSKSSVLSSLITDLSGVSALTRRASLDEPPSKFLRRSSTSSQSDKTPWFSVTHCGNIVTTNDVNITNSQSVVCSCYLPCTCRPTCSSMGSASNDSQDIRAAQISPFPPLASPPFHLKLLDKASCGSMATVTHTVSSGVVPAHIVVPDTEASRIRLKSAEGMPTLCEDFNSSDDEVTVVSSKVSRTTVPSNTRCLPKTTPRSRTLGIPLPPTEPAPKLVGANPSEPPIGEVECSSSISFDDECDTLRRLATDSGLPHEHTVREDSMPVIVPNSNIPFFTPATEYIPHILDPEIGNGPTSLINDTPWMLPDYLQAALDCVSHFKVFFERGIPEFIPSFLRSIPTSDPSLLITVAQIISDIVAAIKSAPSLC